MPEQPPQNCWEFMKCEKKTMEQCPAYKTDSGNKCWLSAANFEKEGCPRVKSEYTNCFECPWFKKLNPSFIKQKGIMASQNSISRFSSRIHK